MQGSLKVTTERITSNSLSVSTMSTLKLSLHCMENAYQKCDWFKSLAIFLWVLLCKFEKAELERLKISETNLNLNLTYLSREA